MTPPPSNPSQDRFARSKSVFLAVLDQPEHQRPTALDQLCAGDTALRDEVARLLAQHATDSPLDRPPPVFQTHATITPDSEPDTPPVRPGQTLGSYTIHAPLGAGGMGVVYEAAHRVTNQPVALKLIRPDAATPRTRRRFEAEGRALARLRHPGIAQVHDAGLARPDNDPSAPAIPYIAMELVRGRPITAAAADLPREDRLRLIEQTARAVHHAHLNGVVHRDLKPANVLVDDQNRVKVLDFGIAKLTEPDESAPAVTTHAGQIIGSPAYMAPEQLGADPRDGGGGGGGVDHRADVYALGVILFEVLTGRRPIETDTASDLWSVLRRVEQGPPALASIDRTCRGDLDVITAVALRADPAERYQSAAELADDLARHLDHRPIRARPRTRRYIVGRFIKRNPWQVAFGAAAAMAIAAGTTGIAIKQQQAAAAERRANERFNETRQLARTMLFDMSDAIARLSGSIPARRLLAETAQAYLDRLAADPAADDDLLLELGEAYTRLGDILGRAHDDNLGDFEGARRNWQRANEILLPLLERNPSNPRVLLAASRIMHSDNLYSHPRNRTDGLLQDQRAFELVQRAAELLPDDPDIAAWYIESHYRWAVGYNTVQQPDECLQMLAAATDSAEARLARWPSHPAVRRAAADAFFWRGYMLIEYDGPGADAWIQRAAEICRQTLESDPTDTPSLQRLATAHMRLAHIAATEGDAHRVSAESHAAIQIATSMASADPTNQFLHRSQSVITAMAGTTHRILADSDPANRAEHLQRAIEYLTQGRTLLQERIDRGWLWPWETHYPDLLGAQIADCVEQLAQITND